MFTIFILYEQHVILEIKLDLTKFENNSIVLMNQPVTAAGVNLNHSLQLPQHKEGLILLD